MRILLTLLLLGGMISSGFSQMNYKVIVTPQNKSLTDTTIRRYQDELRKKQVPDFGIPNAIKIKPQSDVYRGNNGQGFDIYDSPIDNMPILKPDKNNGSNMPVLKYENPEKIIPLQGFLITDSSGAVRWRMLDKQKDTITPRAWEPKIYHFPKK